MMRSSASCAALPTTNAFGSSAPGVQGARRLQPVAKCALLQDEVGDDRRYVAGEQDLEIGNAVAVRVRLEPGVDAVEAITQFAGGVPMSSSARISSSSTRRSVS